MYKKVMSFLDKMKNRYGSDSIKTEEYKKAATILKGKIEEAFKNDKTCCAYFNTESILNALKEDPEFKGFIFKDSKFVPTKKEYKSVLVCWN